MQPHPDTAAPALRCPCADDEGRVLFREAFLAGAVPGPPVVWPSDELVRRVAVVLADTTCDHWEGSSCCPACAAEAALNCPDVVKHVRTLRAELERTVGELVDAHERIVRARRALRDRSPQR
jgi:hypothetical protein